MALYKFFCCSQHNAVGGVIGKKACHRTVLPDFQCFFCFFFSFPPFRIRENSKLFLFLTVYSPVPRFHLLIFFIYLSSWTERCIPTCVYTHLCLLFPTASLSSSQSPSKPNCYCTSFNYITSYYYLHLLLSMLGKNFSPEESIFFQFNDFSFSFI